ncbi:type I-E CRISPR-associated protein Cas5/CasD [Dermacoccus sp. PE3]|uniref:type I-E CRISPR-associated protein Cas5/CasD n=1 Tax=Dermacoccus sp. PE3 TaxID=1641401 RepID=UPI00069C0D92|nr:type I-E CRISPR-associated protein Cas5/CasD [Dermacoccus sp. PE3]
MSEQALMLLRLAGAPTQAWNSARHAYSPGGHHARHLPALDDVTPRKSNLVGLLGAALGRRRDPVTHLGHRPEADLEDLESLRYLVRVDLEGHLRSDFVTSRGHTTTGRPVMRPMSEVVVDDAAYLVGVSGDRTLLESAWEALARPVFQLSLGRREYPLVLPVRMHFETGTARDLDEVMREWLWLAPQWARPTLGRKVTLRLYEARHPRVTRAGLPAYRATTDAVRKEHPPVEVLNPDGNPGLDPIDWLLAAEAIAPRGSGKEVEE